MNQTASQFVGDIPGNYDRCLGPNIFEDYAADIARRAVAARPTNVLELAAGTGIVSRKLRDALPGDVKLTVTDLNAPMLEIARQKFGPSENVTFAPVDAMQLDFDDGAFDLIVCQFGVMFFPDKRASFREALRVLRSGGHYLFNTWGAIAENPFARIAFDVGSEAFPADPPGFYRVPFSCAYAPAVIADLESSGFRAVEHHAIPLKKGVKDIAAFAHGLVYGNPLNDDIARRGGNPDDFVHTIEGRLHKEFGEPPVMPLKANVFSARRP